MRIAAAIVAVLLASAGAYAAEPTPLARARMLYNAADYDGAIAAAAIARTQPAAADAAALVAARAHIERYRRGADPADLEAPPEAPNAIRPPRASPRGQGGFPVAPR